jgi:hypothetical protein
MMPWNLHPIANRLGLRRSGWEVRFGVADNALGVGAKNASVVYFFVTRFIVKANHQLGSDYHKNITKTFQKTPPPPLALESSA